MAGVTGFTGGKQHVFASPCNLWSHRFAYGPVVFDALEDPHAEVMALV